ncbi:hypothetical protein CB1_009595005 [Camelus ferus]|nr:hypothetical protein CB1_009595005 [Camelus ferus]
MLEDRSAELPPPYTAIASPDASGIPVINCRVCQSLINLDGKLHQHVVKCTVCNEATFRLLKPSLATLSENCLNNTVRHHLRFPGAIHDASVPQGSVVKKKVGTQDFARRFHATYVSWAIAYLLGLICLIRACYWGAIRTSSCLTGVTADTFKDAFLWPVQCCCVLRFPLNHPPWCCQNDPSNLQKVMKDAKPDSRPPHLFHFPIAVSPTPATPYSTSSSSCPFAPPLSSCLPPPANCDKAGVERLRKWLRHSGPRVGLGGIPCTTLPARSQPAPAGHRAEPPMTAVLPPVLCPHGPLPKTTGKTDQQNKGDD